MEVAGVGRMLQWLGYFETSPSSTTNGTMSRFLYDSLITAYKQQRPTVMARIKRTGTGTILGANVPGFSSDGRGYCLNVGPGGQVRFFIGNASGSFKVVTGSTVLQTNTWYHVAGLYDGTYLKVYVNGVLDGTTNVGSVTISYTSRANCGPIPPTLYIGLLHNDYNTAWNYTPHLFAPFNGIIDEVKLYNRALTLGEIQKDYQRTSVVAYEDYYPFGQTMAGRSYTSSTDWREG